MVSTASTDPRHPIRSRVDEVTTAPLVDPAAADRAHALRCRAPHVALELDARGLAYACCANGLYPIGRVGRASLREIWDGPRARFLRRAVEQGDLSHGCVTCRLQLDHGSDAPVARTYDAHVPDSDDPAWPRTMAFALHNTCNLQCAMCNGEFSSSIRAQVEQRPALPRAYGDAFFDQLDEFLPHLELARFLGGEPFLVAEHHRIWDRMVELGLDTTCHVTTNGTRYDQRIEELLERLRFGIQVSIDGATPATFEAVRRGASHAEVLANARRFAAYARERGTAFGINFCLLRTNWHELGEVLALGDELDAPVNVILVQEEELGLLRLPADDLAEVHRAMLARDAVWTASLTRNRSVWTNQVAQIEAALARPRRAAADGFVARPGTVSLTEVAIGRRRSLVAGRESVLRAEAVLRRWSTDATTVTCHHGPDDRIDRFEQQGDGDLLGLTAADLLGATLAEVLDRLRSRRGDQVWVVDAPVGGGSDLHLAFTPEIDAKLGLVVRVVTIEDGAGVHSVLAADGTFVPSPSVERATR